VPINRLRLITFIHSLFKYFHAYAWYKCPVCLIWKNQPRDIVEHVIMEHPGQRNTTVLECANCQKGHPVDNFKKHALKCFKREIGIKLSLRR
jgi:radical SAM superfamily enzyme